jgi:transcriptional regulator with XRE-family HTH domain
MTLRPAKIPPQFGRRLRRERERRGWSVKQVAISCGISHVTLHAAEKGGDMTLSAAIAVAAKYGLSLDVLLAEPVCVTCDGVPPAPFICPDCHPSLREESA